MAGSATDTRAGVGSVQVSLRRAADGQYWDGLAWQPTLQWLLALGTANWSLSSGLPSGASLGDGSYVLQSRAADAAGNVETAGPSVTWTRDSVAPLLSAVSATPGTLTAGGRGHDHTALPARGVSSRDNHRRG